MTKLFWFAYAIAREETNGDGGNPFYNNFLYNGGGGATKTSPWSGHEGRPDWNNDSYYSKAQHRLITTKGTGGYGLFQLTYREDIYNSKGRMDAGDPYYIMPRDWIWNWQSNTAQAMIDLNGHVSAATSKYNWLVANFPSIQSERCPTTGDDQDVFNAYEGILVCLNNGDDGFGQMKGKNVSTPWFLNISTGTWTFTGTYAIKVAGFVQ